MLLSFIGSQICANLSCEKNENKHLAHLENNLLFKKRGKFISEMRPTYLTSSAYPQWSYFRISIDRSEDNDVEQEDDR